MMATTEPENIPQTIRSRCQHFSFHAVKFDDILAQLRMIADTGRHRRRRRRARPAGRGRRRLDARRALHHGPGHRLRAAGATAAPHLDAAQIRELMGSVPNAVFERLLEAVGGARAPS